MRQFPGKKTDFHGFDCFEFDLDGVPCRIVVPEQPADGTPWVWRARFFGVEPQFDLAMLARGYHVVYCDVADLFGSPTAVERWNRFYDYLRFEHLFSDRAVLEGLSRGGLIIYNWAIANPDKVVCIYADNPVCDFKSWPGGKGIGPGAPRAWEKCLEAYGMTEDEALAYDGNPVDRLTGLAHAGIPLLHVVGDADEIVPVNENTTIVEEGYKAMGGRIEVIHKPGGKHHPHSLKDPTPIIDFVLDCSRSPGIIPAVDIVSDRNFILRSDFRNSRLQFEHRKRGHVAFIGGSITEMDGYRPLVCEMLRERFPETAFTFTNAGISSTCSDTGAFRFGRDVLSRGPLDLLFVEFAVNDDQDGVCHPEDALRGMEGIVVQARRHNPNIEIVMTIFVNEHILDCCRKGQGVPVIDIHTRVAGHYGVSVNHLAQEVADLINAGKMTWETFGGVHPNIYGNTLCATLIRNALFGAWERPLPDTAKPGAYPQPDVLDACSYVNGRFLSFADVTADENWHIGIPDWPAENTGTVRPRFRDVPMIYSSKEHARLTIAFEGTAIGAYVLSGPDAGIIRCRVDGGPSREIDTLHRHSGFNYPMTVMFFTELSPGRHVVELEILDKRSGRIKPGGTAFRAIAFVAN